MAVAWSRSLSSYFPTNTLNGQARLTFMGGRLGTNYSAYWDIQRDTLVQQRIVAFYNAQCCGIVMQLQEYSIRLLRRGDTDPEGSPVQPGVHARRHRHLLEFLRQLRGLGLLVPAPLVTGAAGFVGRHLLSQLAASGHGVGVAPARLGAAAAAAGCRLARRRAARSPGGRIGARRRPARTRFTTAPASRTSATRGPRPRTRWPATPSAPPTCSGRSARSACRRGSWSPARRQSIARRASRSPRTPRSLPTRPTAPASWRRRWWRSRHGASTACRRWSRDRSTTSAPASRRPSPLPASPGSWRSSRPASPHRPSPSATSPPSAI